MVYAIEINAGLISMSIEVMQLVWNSKFPCAQTKMIALKMADCSNDEGAQIFPSIATVVMKTECSRSTVHKYLKQLDEVGLLVVAERETGGHKTYGSRRQFNMDMLRSLGARETELVFVGPPKERVLAIQEMSRGPSDKGAVGRRGPSEVIQGSVQTRQGGRPTDPTLKRTLNNLSLSGGRESFNSFLENSKANDCESQNRF